jgi:hypothetical protein
MTFLPNVAVHLAGVVPDEQPDADATDSWVGAPYFRQP